MKPHRKRRLYFVIVLLVGVGTAVGVSLYAVGQDINLYYTPSQLLKDHVSPNQVFRLGGMVKEGSIHHVPNSLKVTFVLTDYKHERKVEFNGILPVLFRAGQGIVVQGKLNRQGILIADQVLAKHDNKYMPPEIKKKMSG